MDANPSLDYSALLQSYGEARRISSRLLNEIGNTLDKSEIYETGSRLGILQRGTLLVESDTEINVVMDFTLRHLYRDGKNAIERFPQCAGRNLDSDELDAVERLAISRYRILDVDSVEPGVGLMVTDRLRRESGLLVDLFLSASATTGDFFAGNVVEWNGYWAGTSAALPMSDRIWARLERPINKRFGKFGPRFRNLDRSQDAVVAAWCIRACLEAGMARQVTYLDPAPFVESIAGRGASGTNSS